MSFLLDTNICVALLRSGSEGIPKHLRSLDPEDIYLCSVVRAELLYGARKSRWVEENLALVERFCAQFESLPFDDKAASFYGITRAILTKAGASIGANDLLVASIGLAHDLTIVTRNTREFSRVPGLRIESW
ncbi:MAG: type II toxin-antitoxin system VapC family toxin [Acidobacteria bacterium]|nr:type II toxin-antitoxin system VapC family toxin [Acidobacteriota bacterium]